MTREQIFAIVQVIISEYMGTVSVDNIRFESDFIKDLGMDSLDLMSVASEIEDRFDIRIDDETLVDISTVGELFDEVVRCCDAKK